MKNSFKLNGINFCRLRWCSQKNVSVPYASMENIEENPSTSRREESFPVPVYLLTRNPDVDPSTSRREEFQHSTVEVNSNGQVLLMPNSNLVAVNPMPDNRIFVPLL